MVPNSGHNAFLDNPRRVCKLITGFFKGELKDTFEIKPRKLYTPPLNPLDYPTVPRNFRQATNCTKHIIDNADNNRIIQIMSYNLLAESKAIQRGGTWHVHAQDNYLDISFRAPRIL